MASEKFSLRVYSYLDRMQPQYAAFVGTITQGDLPTEGMASVYVELAPGNEVFRRVDIAGKSTEAKETRLVEAEAINPSDLKAAKSALRSIQERWESIGHVPRGDKERIEGRLRRVEDAVRKGEQDQWKRTNPEAKARADATVEQFGASLAKLEKEHAKLVAAGDDRKAADVEGRIATTKTLLEAAERAAAEFSG